MPVLLYSIEQHLSHFPVRRTFGVEKATTEKFTGRASPGYERKNERQI